MKIRTVGKCVKEGFHSVFHNGLMSVASIGTITACLLILGIVYCLVVNVRYFADSLGSNLGIVAFLSEGVTDDQINELSATLDSRDDVSDYKYVSPEEAWETFKNEMLGSEVTTTDSNGSETELMQELDEDNPLKNSANFEIYPDSSEHQQQIVDYLKTVSYVRKISYSANASQALTSFGRMVTLVGGALIILLVFVALLLIANTVRMSVYIRRNEINIMKYIGATDAFVRLPFVVEGIVIGVLGAIIPILLVYFGYYKLTNLLAQHFSSISNMFMFIPLNQILRGLIPMFLVLSVVVGVVGSMISMHRHLKV